MVIEGMFGLSFENPLRHMREYLSVLMSLLHDRTCAFAGTTMSTSVSVGVPAADVPPPPVLIAALGPKMLELAGTVADGTVTWMTGPATLASHTVPTITAAAAAAGRPAPEVFASLPICVTDDPASARERGSKEFQVYGFLPSYRAMLDREGAEKPGDVALAGDESTVEKELTRLEDAGVTEFVASIFGTREERDRTRAFLKDAR
jgi:5,10-methylenetetrahydromethanopterin reductase